VNKFWLRNSKTVLTCLMDCAFLFIAFAAAILLYTYFRLVPGGFGPPYIKSLPLMALSCILIFSAFGIYRDLWGYLSLMDLVRISVASALTAFLSYAYMRIMRGAWASPVIGVTGFYLFLSLTLGVRILPSIISRTRKYFALRTWNDDKRTPLLIIGAGEAGSALIKDLQNRGNTCHYRIVGIIDDDTSKQKHSLRSIPIIGTSKNIPALVEQYGIHEIIIAIPSATTEERRQLIAICSPTGCKVRMMNAVSNMNDASVTSLRNLDVGDLLGRKEIILDPAIMATYITGHSVMITGGGGSIGSELCRQILRFQPSLLIIYDIYENNAYNLYQELRMTYPSLANRIQVRIGSVQDSRRLNMVFSEMCPKVVFHAAAYKHVPLMEECPELAIQNNVFGTFNAAQCALRHNVRRFVMISTDKAVNPTNIMGASKRLAEKVIQSMNNQGTEFVAVRFGNVLGSNGSVVPIFKRQIEAGGPVTITHPDIIRYFMTIPEAARLVLQAGAIAKGGETFVLDMGEPVKIVNLAKSMIEMAGLVPNVDIEIKYTGLRPGEKLYEELLLSVENVEKTSDDKIFITQSSQISNQERWEMLEKLHDTIEQKKDIQSCVKKLLSSYHPQNMI